MENSELRSQFSTNAKSVWTMLYVNCVSCSADETAVGVIHVYTLINEMMADIRPASDITTPIPLIGSVSSLAKCLPINAESSTESTHDAITAMASMLSLTCRIFHVFSCIISLIFSNPSTHAHALQNRARPACRLQSGGDPEGLFDVVLAHRRCIVG